MPYPINKSDGTQLLTLSDQTANTTATSLTLIGRGYLNFGKDQAENFVKLLENFAKNSPPANPLVGQQWYDKGTNKMKVWDGTAWKRILLGPDDNNLIPGVVFGEGLSVVGNTVVSNLVSVAGRVGNVVLGVGDIAGAAPIVSPTFAGVPAAPTPATGTNTTQIATTQFVRSQIAASSTNNVTTDIIGDGLKNDSGSIIVVSEDDSRVIVSNNGINISPTYIGQTTITTIGTITNGVWNAATLDIAHGGTNATTADQALTNLGAMKFNGLANSLKDAGVGIMVNNNGSAVARKIVSGTPDKIVVNNPNGETGDITISLTGTDNTGPVPISGGGTGATNKESALNALMPTTTAGDMVYRNNAGSHSRLAGRVEPYPFYLESGSGSSDPRWTSTVYASFLEGKNLAHVLSRANHTGEINADKLQNYNAAQLLDYANFTGAPPAAFIFSSKSFEDSGWIVYRGGFQMVWSRVTVGGNATTSFNFPLAFPTRSVGAVASGGGGGSNAQDNNPYVANVSSTQVIISNSRDLACLVYYIAYGF